MALRFVRREPQLVKCFAPIQLYHWHMHRNGALLSMVVEDFAHWESRWLGVES